MGAAPLKSFVDAHFKSPDALLCHAAHGDAGCSCHGRITIAQLGTPLPCSVAEGFASERTAIVCGLLGRVGVGAAWVAKSRIHLFTFLGPI